VTRTRRLPTHHVAAVVIGNALEFYDFLSFGFFAVNLARVMFPAGAPGVSLLLTVMTGSLGFLARPIGAVIFGVLGDRIGRKPMMLATFLMMGTGALGLALTPTYGQIGIWAPTLVVVFRLIQGLAAGGDVGPTTAYLVESAPAARRGLYASLQYGAMRIGVTVSGLVGLSIASVMSPSALDSLGWRLAFGIGAAIVPFAFVMRRRLDETLHQPELDASLPSTLNVGLYVTALVGVFGALTLIGINDFLYTFSVSWLAVPSRTAYWLTVVNGAEQLVCVVLGGWLADRYGRRGVALTPAVIGAVIVLPLFSWMASDAHFGRLVVATLLLTPLTMIAAAASYVTLVEVTPKRWRSGLIGVGYGLIVALSFGFAPPILTAYVQRSGDLRAPGYGYLLGYILAACAALLMPETRPPTLDGRRHTEPSKSEAEATAASSVRSATR